jgi:toxin ParE1/3/4
VSELVRTPEAVDDAIDIWNFIAQYNQAAATRLLQSFDKKLEMLAEAPGVGSRRDELRSELRSFTVGEYILFYRPISNGIELVRILHGKRDIPDEFHA